MKVHTDLKELLKAYDEYRNNVEHYGLKSPKVNITNFLTFNSLALGKPEPLAKNKQFEKVCEYCNGWELDELGDECNYCNGTGIM